MTRCCFLCKSSTPHVLLCRRIRFELCRFRSPLLTTSRLISSPAPTKMFQFGAFPLVSKTSDDIHRQDVPFGDPGFRDSMHLPRAYRSLARPSSASQTEPSNDKHIYVYSPLLPCNVLSYRDRQIPIHGFHMVVCSTICPSLEIYISRCIKNTNE